MGTEIERKFLLLNEHWRQQVSHSERMVQGYLAGNERASVRVRISGNSANLNIKSATLAISRQEFEYEIPMHEAEILLSGLCEKPLIDKIRHYVTHQGKIWEIDEFSGDNAGLVVAELELDSPEEDYDKPEWVGIEVSHDVRYYNVNLVKHPFKSW